MEVELADAVAVISMTSPPSRIVRRFEMPTTKAWPLKTLIKVPFAETLGPCVIVAVGSLVDAGLEFWGVDAVPAPVTVGFR